MKMIALAAVGLIALAGCSGGNREPEVLNETGDDANITVVEENVAAPVLPENVTNTAEPAAPPPAFTDDQQMRDDADASGLTARLPDESVEPGQGGNETRPAE